MRHLAKGLLLGLVLCTSFAVRVAADTIPVQVLDPTLKVTTVLNAGIVQPIGIVFLAQNDFLVLEKASGQVKRVINGVIQAAPVLDLAVNSNSERGLLSLVLHPNFPTTPLAYVRWTESSTGADTNVVLNVPLLGNRVDRFIWDGSTLTFDRNIIRLRALQTDNIAVTGHAGTNNANPAGNHNGGVMRFGPDGKLYLFMGDQGRRGWLQNLPSGPFESAPFVDDTFGGPEPDNAHLSGVILRLNDDGSTPADNPFVGVGSAMGGEVGANIQKVYSYGHRNGFGMAFDPYSGDLWETENGDDSFSELNRVVAGMNGGWIQTMGPQHRFFDFKDIEVNEFGGHCSKCGSRQRAWRTLPAKRGSACSCCRAPGTSIRSSVGSTSQVPRARPSCADRLSARTTRGHCGSGRLAAFQQVGGNGGGLYRIRLSRNRKKVDVSDPKLAEGVADNIAKFDPTESESLLIGRGFGTTPDIEQGPDGNLYVVSITDGAIYMISRQ